MPFYWAQPTLYPALLVDPVRRTVLENPGGLSAGDVPAGVPAGALQVTWAVAHFYSNGDGGNLDAIDIASGGGDIIHQISGASGRQRSAVAVRNVPAGLAPLVFAKGAGEHKISTLSLYLPRHCRVVGANSVFVEGVGAVDTPAVSADPAVPTRWFKLLCTVTGQNPHTISGSGWTGIVTQTGQARQIRGWARSATTLSTSIAAETMTFEGGGTGAFAATIGVTARETP